MANLLSAVPNADALKLNQIQVRDTHSSYHIQPSAGINTLLTASGAQVVSTDYSEPNLAFSDDA